MDNLLSRKIVERIGVNSLSRVESNNFLKQLENKWELIDDKKISYSFRFRTFKDAISFVNKIADLAEKENHHPSIFINYNKVKINLSTHSVGGLSENDFILAAKIETLI